MVSYQIKFRVGKSVPIKNWRGNRFGGETDGEVADGVCTNKYLHKSAIRFQLKDFAFSIGKI